MTPLVFTELNGSRYGLRGELVFATAEMAFSEGVRRLMALSRGARCEFDCAGLSDADSAGLAVLIEWKAEAARRGVVLVYQGLPAAVERLARISDVETLLKAA